MSCTAVSLTTWFRAASLGVTTAEVLSRASAFFTSLSDGGGIGLLSSAHVTHPHRFRHYFPGSPFLTELNDESLLYSIEVRDVTTGVPLSIARLPLHARPKLESRGRDASAFFFPPAEGAALLDKLRVSPSMSVETVPLAREAVREGGALIASGHFLLPDVDDDGNDTSRLLPKRVNAKLIARTPAQTFAATECDLEMGMCGGPFLRLRESGDGYEAAGLVEGIVPRAAAGGDVDSSVEQREFRRLLGGSAALIDSFALTVLLNEARASARVRE